MKKLYEKGFACGISMWTQYLEQLNVPWNREIKNQVLLLSGIFKYKDLIFI